MHPPTLLVAIGIPVVVLAGSYLLLVREFGRWNLWNVKIHESGRHTLAETIFYYDHFLRELPIDSLFALAIFISYSAIVPQASPQPAIFAWSLLGLACFLACVAVGSLRRVGWRMALADLLQSRETDIRRGWGTHWQMHFLSTAAILALLLLPALALPEDRQTWSQLCSLVLIFVVASVVFRTGPRAITDHRWILHGAREVLTYLIVVAIPFYLLLLDPFLLTGRLPGPAAWVVLGFLILLALYYLVVYTRNDLRAEASSPRGIAFLLSSHFIEHALDYVYVLLACIALLAHRTS